uniref:Chemokine interleukin-8-like domain-containing protein n=1 Tax=Astatotilapia calliptera TaxID=8154 RepID=A0AAX7UFJ2_ASTCA
MCPTLSISRWIFLLCLPVVISLLFSFHAAHSSAQSLGLPCCHKVITQEVKTIQSCFEQKPRYHLNTTLNFPYKIEKLLVWAALTRTCRRAGVTMHTRLATVTNCIPGWWRWSSTMELGTNSTD